MFNEIFEIPIYRLSFETRVQEIEREKEKYFQYFKKNDVHNYRTRGNTDRTYEERYRKCRHYNEIIGYIKIYADGRKIYGDRYWIKEGKIRRDLKRKTFGYLGKTFETWVFPNMSNEDILKGIIETIKGERYLKNRFLDTRNLEAIGEYVNWRKLCGIER